MKSTRNLVSVALVLLLMLTAVGYAAWSDTLVVDGTASTGTFEVQFTEVTTASPKSAEGTFTYKLSDSKQTSTFTLTNAKEGEIYTAELTATNLGTVEAIVKNETIATAPDKDLYEIGLEYYGSDNKWHDIKDSNKHNPLSPINADNNGSNKVSQEQYRLTIKMKNLDKFEDKTETGTFTFSMTYMQNREVTKEAI